MLGAFGCEYGCLRCHAARLKELLSCGFFKVFYEIMRVMLAVGLVSCALPRGGFDFDLAAIQVFP